MKAAERGWTSRVLNLLRRYLTFFLLTAFIVTCCIMLFTATLLNTMGIELTEAEVSTAARLTMANVLLLSFIFSVIDWLRHRLMVERPVKRITRAAEQVMKGDFSVRIQPFHSIEVQDGFDTIIEYFNRMTEELAGIETLRTDFIANVSHELKTPLAVMQNYGAMLREPGLPEEKRVEYAKAVTDASRRLAGLVSNILKLNKLENQQIYPQSDSYDLGEQLCECLVVFEDTWEEKNIEIETDIAEDITIAADREMMGLVWSNLLSNAFKFTEPGGTVGLSLTANGDSAVVQVSDTGCGISQEVGKHMFDKFYQGDSSHASQGNGLGLALVKRIVDITGSEISVESELGKGSVFTVKLRRGQSEKLRKNPD